MIPRRIVAEHLGALAAFVGILPILAFGDIEPSSAALYLDFARGDEGVEWHHGARRVDRNRGVATFGGARDFGSIALRTKLDGVTAASVGGWFFLRRSGEQTLFSRGEPEVGENGERFFRPAPDWVKFFIGTDQRGFFMGSMNGNSRMPFPMVTLAQPTINAWHQLVVVKAADGSQHFFHNGVRVHTDTEAEPAGQVIPFHDRAPGEPIRLAVPHGGLIGEAWVFARALSAG